MSTIETPPSTFPEEAKKAFRDALMRDGYEKVLDRLIAEYPGIQNERYVIGKQKITPIEYALGKHGGGAWPDRVLRLLHRGAYLPADTSKMDVEAQLKNIVDRTTCNYYKGDVVGEVRDLRNLDTRHKPSVFAPHEQPKDGAYLINPEYLHYACLIAISQRCTKFLPYEHCDIELAAALLRNTPGNWSDISENLNDFSSNDYDNLKDTTREISEHLIRNFLSYAIGDKICPFISADAIDHNIIEETHPLVARALLKDKSLIDALKLSKQWHMHRRHILDQFSPVDMSAMWQPFITEPITVTGGRGKDCTITPLYCANGLKAEAKTMDHCIDGASFVTAGLSGRSHYASIQDVDGKKLSTVEFSVVNGNEIHIRQHRAKHDRTPGPQAKAAFQWFEAQVKSGKITLNNKVGKADENQAITLLEQDKPAFDLNENKQTQAQLLEAAFQSFIGGARQKDGGWKRTSRLRVGKHTHLIDKKWHERNAVDFVIESGVADVLIASLKEDKETAALASVVEEFVNDHKLGINPKVVDSFVGQVRKGSSPENSITK